MANKQVRANHPLGVSHKNDALTKSYSNGGTDPSTVTFEVVKGRNVDSHAERKASGKKPWRGGTQVQSND